MSHTEVKICGLVRTEDALAALDFGADYLGFVIYRHSPRGITGNRLAKLRDRLPITARCVAVFVNAPRCEVERIAGDCALHAVQIHGDELAAEFAEFPVPVWRAIQLNSGTCSPEPAKWTAQRYVIDAAPAGVYGGSGQMADWDVAKRVAGEHCVMLAGGLTAENVADSIYTVRPAGVDVSSGVELRPGVKDRAKIKRFLESVKLTNERGCE